MKRNYFQQSHLYFTLLVLAISFRSYAQPLVSGPDCIIPGLTYQYILTGDWKPGSTAKLCITGGNLLTGNACTPDGSIPYMILVIWGTGKNRKIELTSSLGKFSLNITGTSALDGGQINAKDKEQEFNKKSGYTYRCTEASGGSCTPDYVYQWQSSQNGLEWKNIDGETKRDLKFSDEISGNIYFRRVTNELRSNTTGYSDTGLLNVRL
jgi:hypothetical protein